MSIEDVRQRLLRDNGDAGEILAVARNDARDIRTLNVTEAGNITDGYDYYRCDGTFTETLPAATGSLAAYCVKNVGTGVITVDGAGDETIDGAASITLYAKDGATFLDVAAGAWDVLGG